MNKKRKILIVIVAVLATLWGLGNLTHALQLFSSPSVSNEPAIKMNERFFVSNLVKPKRFDFICYYGTNPQMGRHLRVHRLCGLEGDTLEMRNGDLWINGKYADGSLSLTHNYIFPATEWEKVKAVQPPEDLLVSTLLGDSMTWYLTDKDVVKHAINARREILPPGEPDEYISDKFSRPWNKDHFGPVIVPPGKYFVLGDNRSSSEDSRYIGFVDKTDCLATVLWKK